MIYFAFGSNMLTKRLEERIGKCGCLGRAILKKYKLAFNKLAKDGSGKANIVFTGNNDNHVYGVCFNLDEDQLNTLDEFEIGYIRDVVKVSIGTNIMEAATYIANSEAVHDNLHINKKYLQFCIDGGKEHGLPKDYIQFLESTILSSQ